MRWSRVCVEAISYVLPDERVSSERLEARLGPFYRDRRLPGGQIEALTGVCERRFWPPGPVLGEIAAGAGERALAEAGVGVEDLGVVIYAGVCRDNLEPATACVAADRLGVRGEAVVLDHSNACLGVLNGMVTVANMIELGQVRAGIVLSAESAREIADTTVERVLRENSLETWRDCLASLTGGSGAVAVVLTEREFSFTRRALLGGVVFAAPEHHGIARWGPSRGILGESTWVMETDAPAVLTHGVDLGRRTWIRFLEELEWRAGDVEKVICHQVGTGHRRAILEALELDADREYATFERLGNMGTVSLPATAAMAAEEGFIAAGDRVGFLGIGTGLNCLMLGIQW